MLHAAVTAARRGYPADAHERLTQAATLAEQFGRDGNECWTAFGPTNVLLHQLAVEATLDRTTAALRTRDRIDTSRMPPGLRSRRAQVHLDLAVVHGRSEAGDPQAVLHLLEAERVAPQVIGCNAKARSLLTTLLSRERRSATPGLRALAHRAGVMA